MTPRQARRIIAADAASKALAKAEEYSVVGWEDYADIGEYDWDQISKQILAIAEKLAPHGADVDDAYGVLSVLAES